jgi:asparagine synthase (glutamine-hydrolysing)
MCGIFGVWNFKSVTGAQLHRASALLHHRGPDDEGFVVFSEGEARSFGGSNTTTTGLPHLPDDLPCHNALLHRRLSILDLSANGHQPMQIADRRIHVVFNGEIYNFKEIIATHGLKVNSGTDTEVVLQLYAKLGTNCFTQFRGMWSMAILDLERGELILSRDRFGIKPLYFAEANGGLAFSSEIKPLLSLDGIEATWAKKKLLQFLTFGATDDPHETFIDGIYALKPGYFKTWNIHSLQSKETAYYDLRKLAQTIAEQPKPFHHVFGESISEHLISDVEVGSCLSGGLDSTAIVANASLATNGFKTFTCSFPGEAIDESNYARMLIEINPNLDQHFTTPTADEFFAEFDKLILLQERPVGSASIFAQYAVMKLAASKGMKVLLDGQGADEVMGGYYPFAGSYLLELLKKGKFIRFRKELKALKLNFNPAMGKAMIRSAYYSLPLFLQVIARKRSRVGAALIAEKYRKAASGLPAPQRGSANFKELTLRSIEFGLYELLHYEDRNAMHFGIESRVPFLDHRLVEWALSRKPDELIHEGWTKYPIREELANAGLNSLAWRRDKLGFVAPQNRWREELKPLLLERFRAMAVLDVFDRGAIERLMTDNLGSNENLTEFWRIYALLRWLQLFNVKLI